MRNVLHCYHDTGNGGFIGCMSSNWPSHQDLPSRIKHRMPSFHHMGLANFVSFCGGSGQHRVFLVARIQDKPSSSLINSNKSIRMHTVIKTLKETSQTLCLTKLVTQSTCKNTLSKGDNKGENILQQWYEQIIAFMYTYITCWPQKRTVIFMNDCVV